MSKGGYGNYPRGCRFSNKTSNKMVPVVLEDLAQQGTRAQRRYAARELRKINNKAGVRP